MRGRYFHVRTCRYFGSSLIDNHRPSRAGQELGSFQLGCVSLLQADFPCCLQLVPASSGEGCLAPKIMPSSPSFRKKRAHCPSQDWSHARSFAYECLDKPAKLPTRPEIAAAKGHLLYPSTEIFTSHHIFSVRVGAPGPLTPRRERRPG